MRLEAMNPMVTAAALALAVGGCVTESVSRIEHRYVPAQHRAVRIEPCQDRTDTAGGRDLKTEATDAFAAKLRDSGLFEIAPQASLVLTCDIERFAEGSAFKRWVLPGWGSTQAGVAVLVWEQPGDRLLATFRSQSHVDAGGLYTVGADRYIFATAFENIVKQMKDWMSRSGPEKPR